ncbi:hypothetical protein GCM10010421_21850 [Streptomyces glaucus]|uniref:Uncharacterized protein n=1 Tax=Streptomyces glaucus TaxID=284029 RepID=A0ABP5WPL2_9ACTN
MAVPRLERGLEPGEGIVCRPSARFGIVHVEANRAKGGPNGGPGKVPSDIRQHQEPLD